MPRPQHRRIRAVAKQATVPAVLPFSLLPLLGLLFGLILRLIGP